MANRPAPALVLRDGDRERLERWLRSRSVRAGLVKRARMILLAAEGVGNREIAQRVAASPTTVIQWGARYWPSAGSRAWRIRNGLGAPGSWITLRS